MTDLSPKLRAAALNDFLWRLEQSSGHSTAQKLLDDNPDLEQILAAAVDKAAEPDASIGELGSAADFLRTAVFRGAMTATPAVAALVRARQPLAELLGCLAMLTPADRGGDTCHWCGGNHALDIARAVNGTAP